MTVVRQRVLPQGTTVPLHLNVDGWWDVVSGIAFGRVDDGLPAEQLIVLDEDPRVTFVLDAPDRGPVIGFIAQEPWAIDVAGLTSAALWDGPRFDVPALGLTAASVGEILLAVRARFGPGDSTAPTMHFHVAMGTMDTGDGATDAQTLIERWRMALEAGDVRATFGLGCTLVDAGRPREAYDLLRRYTELTPHNAWAWCWLGRACLELGEVAEARSALECAVAAELLGSDVTDARALLDDLAG